MLITIDAGSLAVKNRLLRGGVFYLNYNLLKSLSLEDNKNHYHLLSFSNIPGEILYSLGTHMQNKVLKPSKYWLALRLSWEFFLKKPDIFLGLGQSLPLYHPAKNIIFVYDLAFERYPECYPKAYHKLSRNSRYATHRADKIIAISKSTKRDLIDLYKVKKEKIEVVYPGVDEIFSPQKEEEILKIRKKYSLKKTYFLFIGSLKPIKNLPRIIEAFAIFSKENKGFQLVLSGSNFWFDKKIEKTIKKFKLERKIKNLGYVKRKDLPSLYCGAQAFVSPSLYEGFGMPILEAMACGTPVITSNVSSMPEVVGEAAIKVDPLKTMEIANALKKIVKRKKFFSKQGLIQAKKFSWKKFARNVLKIMNNL